MTLFVITPVVHAEVSAGPLNVADTLAHDRGAFTQGFLIDEWGRWYESTGQYGRSELRRVDAATGWPVAQHDLARNHFGEGLARVDDRLYQLTWKAGRVFVYDRDTFALENTLSYTGEGWGLARCGDQLVMSNGSDTLTFRDPTTFAIQDRLPVRLNGHPAPDLNELEVIHGMIWANQWHTARILIIDPGSGRVVALRDASRQARAQPAGADVLNGIAYDAGQDRVYITGKRWAHVYKLGPDAARIGVSARTSQRCLR